MSRRNLVAGITFVTLVALLEAAPPDTKTVVVREPPLTDAQRAHWSFVPPRAGIVPETRRRGWARNPIDAFVLARLEAAGLSPAPEADRLTRLRRLSLDLTGLPPTVAEQDAFLADRRPDAYERQVERLLASPHFGARQAQHWLDTVRFAESNGYELDADRPDAWRYRDYVVDALNADTPYDRFVREQLAGDLLAGGRRDGPSLPLWAATGLHRCGPAHVVSGNTDPAELRQEALTEMVAGVGSALLGLTVGCARCHDHKFDPLSQADFYRLQAYFAGTRDRDFDASTPAERSAYKAARVPLDKRIAEIQARVEGIDAPARDRVRASRVAGLPPAWRAALETPADKRTPEQKRLAADAESRVKLTWVEVVEVLPPAQVAERAALRDEQAQLEARLPHPPGRFAAVAEDTQPPTTFVLKRGEVHKRLAAVSPAPPRVLPAGPPVADGRRLTRLDLADWLTRPDHPLTARVMVNRLWQRHFGRGIVGTPGDFGTRGDPPSHPELLDWLAAELPRRGWSLKAMHRLIVTSATYRQASRGVDAPAVEPDNRLLWKMPSPRLDAEAIRDGMRAVSGALNPKLGGPSVRVPLEPAVYETIFTEGEPQGLWPVTPDPAEHRRRALYLFAKRNVRQPTLEALDQPDRLLPCQARGTSTHAPQALIAANGPFAQQCAKDLANVLLAECGRDPARLADRAHRRVLGRPATPEEAAASRAFLGDAGPERVADFALAMLNRTGFVYRP